MSLKQKSNDIINEMDMDLKIAEEELTKDFDDDENEDAEFESYDDDDDDEDEDEEEDKQIKRTRHGKPTPYAPKNGRAPGVKHLYANYGGEVMPYINMFDLQLSYETSDIELLYHLCERINKMIDIINAENKYINKLSDWTEKKIHKLFKHQKKFEKYLLELLDEFEEQMQEEFSEFKDEITKEIEDFENLVNEELEAMNEEINRFENEMKDRADAFEEEMKERADAFEAEMKARADAFEAEVNSRLDAMDKEIADFENEMKLRADNFENTINNTMSEFETEMRNRASEFEETMEKEQSSYENEMNTRANEFESSMNNKADNFETSINKEINDFKTETTNEINEFESLVNSTINDFSTDWTTKLNDFETYINHHIEEFESSMDERADSFEADLKEQWNDFKTKFGDMYNEYITDITNQWNAFKEEMSGTWNSFKNDLQNEWEEEERKLNEEMASYEETMDENYNEFKESIENYIEACCDNVNNEISSFEETVNKLIDDFENEYNTRLEETTRDEVDAKITDIVNQSIYELIQNSEEFRNAISNVVNQLLETSETLKEMITDIVNNIINDIDLVNFDTSILDAIDLILGKKPQILSTNTDNGYQLFYYDNLVIAINRYNGCINYYHIDSNSVRNLGGSLNTAMTSHINVNNDATGVYSIRENNYKTSILELIHTSGTSFVYRYYQLNNLDLSDTDIYHELANFYNIIVFNKETNKSSVYATNLTEHVTGDYEVTFLFEVNGEITSFISDNYNMAYVINEGATIYYINDYRHYKSNISVTLYNCDDFTHIYDMQLYNDKISITATTNLFSYSEDDSCIYTLLYPFDNFSSEVLLQLKYDSYITTIQYNNNNIIPSTVKVTTPDSYTAMYDFSLNLGYNEENDDHTDYLINNGYMFSLALAYIKINKINNGYEHQLTLNLDRELTTSSTFEHDDVFNSLYINDAFYCNVYMFSDIKHVWVNNSIVTYYGRNESIGNFENLPTVSDLQITDSYFLLYLATSIFSHLMRCYIIMYGSQYLNETHCNSCILLANIISSRLENKFELTDGRITDLRDFTYTSSTFNYEDK